MDRYSATFSDSKTLLDFNRLYHAEINNVFREFSIKYVYSGTEHYITENGRYALKKGKILLASAQSGRVFFDNTEETIGTCIYLDRKTISDAFHLRTQCFYMDPDKIFDSFYDNAPFFERIVDEKEVVYGKQLSFLCESLAKQEEERVQFTDEWFYELAHAMVEHEVPHFQFFTKLPYLKNSTKKEVLKRLLYAKIYIDENFSEILSVDEISRIALLSKFHFFRAFKIAFGVTPHQYLLSKKLNYAWKLIAVKEMPISEVARLINFSDQFSFSKAFKKKFGMPPSRLQRHEYENELLSA